MQALVLHDFHRERGGVFVDVGGGEVVGDYGDWRAEHHALTSAAGLIDLSARSRLVLLGADRQAFLNGQVTNDVKGLRVGQGCYAALVDAKAKMLSDLYLYALPEELLLDFEPGLAGLVAERLEKFVLSADVQVVDAAPHYGLLSVQGPKAGSVVEAWSAFPSLPAAENELVSAQLEGIGEVYLTHRPRTGGRGYDVFVPNGALPAVAERLIEATGSVGGRVCGWQALEVARVEAGIPRYGTDMDATNLPPETGIAERAISYTKGCYSGQEVIARIRTYGQVAKALRGLRLEGVAEGAGLPAKGTRLFRNGKEVGTVTSAVASPVLQADIALGYVRRECNQPGSELQVGAAESTVRAIVVPLPFVGPLWAGSVAGRGGDSQ